MALEDVARIKPHSYSARCVSSTGVIILMEVNKFNAVVRHIPGGFSEITRINKLKWMSFFDKLAILEDQKAQLTGMQK